MVGSGQGRGTSIAATAKSACGVRMKNESENKLIHARPDFSFTISATHSYEVIEVQALG